MSNIIYVDRMESYLDKEDLYAKLSGWKIFTGLDKCHAYEQLPLCCRVSKVYYNQHTHSGLFSYTRLPYGITVTHSIFHREIDSLFQVIPNILVYLDDILITGKTEEDHLHTLEQLLLMLNTEEISVLS